MTSSSLHVSFHRPLFGVDCRINPAINAKRRPLKAYVKTRTCHLSTSPEGRCSRGRHKIEGSLIIDCLHAFVKLGRLLQYSRKTLYSSSSSSSAFLLGGWLMRGTVAPALLRRDGNSILSISCRSLVNLSAGCFESISITTAERPASHKASSSPAVTVEGTG